MGLPGDLSSPSRFVRCAFVHLNSTHPTQRSEAVNQFFHILGAVEQVEGCVRLKEGLERTQYTSCYDPSDGICYCTTYGNHRLSAVAFPKERLTQRELISYALLRLEDPLFLSPKD